jgi:dihydropteroate synthase
VCRVLVRVADRPGLNHKQLELAPISGVKTYLRPLGLVFGRDARTLVAAGEAGQLGGMEHIGFTQVEIITRDGSRIDRYRSMRDHPVLQSIVAPRSSFGGLKLDACRVMGIVNVTPDSFSDGGKNFDAGAAIENGKRMMLDGADLLDVGGESTRPGSDPVSIDDEVARVEPVIAGLKAFPVSIDTRNAETMRAGMRAGAVIINDVSALTHDAASAALVAKADVPVILMHAQGAPKTMQLAPKYADVVLDVYDALEVRVGAAVVAGIARERIMIDPGIGFGKTFKQNLQLMQAMSLFHGLGLPLLIGLSRKGYVGSLTGEAKAGARVAGSVGGAVQAAMQAAHMLRVHDVKETVHALKVFTASCDPDSVEI